MSQENQQKSESNSGTASEAEEEENDDEEEESQQFEPTKRSKAKSKSKSKKQTQQQSTPSVSKEKDRKKTAPKGKGRAKAKVQQPAGKKAPGKKKAKSKKAPTGGNYEANKPTVLQYMTKQNRPYNILNVFDNLHAKIKKPQLQTILNELSDQKQLTYKDFGKNRIYFLNQDKFDINIAEVNELNSNYNELREEHKDLKDINKKLNDDYKKLMNKKTMDQLEMQELELMTTIEKLQKKLDYLVGGDIVKVDEKEVLALEKQTKGLEKQLKQRRRLVKECLDIWSEALQKKVPEVAEMMGIELV